MQIDEHEMIDFFEVLPTAQSAEEQEFSGKTSFSVSRGGWDLNVSFGEYEDLIAATLARTGESDTAAEVRISGVRNVRIRRDKPNAVPVMIITASDSDQDEAEVTAEIRVTPSPSIKVRNRLRLA